MGKLILVLSVLAVLLIAESSCQKFNRPTLKPPRPRYTVGPVRPPLRIRRDAGDEPLWLYQGDVPKAPSSGDHPVPSSIIDDVKLDANRRTARSLGTPSHVSHGTGGSRRSSSHDTGPTHPGYNRRNARSINRRFSHRVPIPTTPPFNPGPPKMPIYARNH